MGLDRRGRLSTCPRGIRIGWLRLTPDLAVIDLRRD